MLRVYSSCVNQIPELVCVYSTYLTTCRYGGTPEDRWKRFLPKIEARQMGWKLAVKFVQIRREQKPSQDASAGCNR